MAYLLYFLSFVSYKAKKATELPAVSTELRLVESRIIIN